MYKDEIFHNLVLFKFSIFVEWQRGHVLVGTSQWLFDLKALEKNPFGLNKLHPCNGKIKFNYLCKRLRQEIESLHWKPSQIFKHTHGFDLVDVKPASEVNTRFLSTTDYLTISNIIKYPLIAAAEAIDVSYTKLLMSLLYGQ